MFVGVAAAFVAASGSPAMANDMFRNADFLRWPAETRAAYIEISVGMADLIAAQVAPDKVACIESWYCDRPEAAQEELYATMRDYPKHHPRCIILAFIRKRCDMFRKP